VREIARSLIGLSWEISEFTGRQLAAMSNQDPCTAISVAADSLSAALRASAGQSGCGCAPCQKPPGGADESTGWGPVIPDGSN
jgi:hypothetical protein